MYEAFFFGGRGGYGLDHSSAYALGYKKYHTLLSGNYMPL
jgi:hypothetical protein